jgi:hypothetical protein
VLKLIVPPSHKPVGLAVAVGVAGRGLIVTLVVEVLKHPFPSVTVNVYVPDAAVVTLIIDALWPEAVKPPGPVHV